MRNSVFTIKDYNINLSKILYWKKYYHTTYDNPDLKFPIFRIVVEGDVIIDIPLDNDDEVKKYNDELLVKFCTLKQLNE